MNISPEEAQEALAAIQQTGCVAITVLVLIGYYLLPAYFYLWVAISCGLSMFGIGLFVRLWWR